jgi:hypothetical protein
MLVYSILVAEKCSLRFLDILLPCRQGLSLEYFVIAYPPVPLYSSCFSFESSQIGLCLGP